MHLNETAAELCESMLEDADIYRVVVSQLANGATLVDCGIDAEGGLEAGRMLAEICLAGLAEVSFLPSSPEIWSGPSVQVSTDHPVPACMASQYAGWEVTGEKYFAMGSGPMRAAAGREELFQRIGNIEKTTVAIGVLEAAKLPPLEVVDDIAAKCGVKPPNLTLLVAPTKSLAGTVQVVARSIETSLHKLDELGFELARISSAIGWAPLPPPAANDLAGIGRTNDAILYGGEVTLYLHGDDESLQEIGPRIPSGASDAHGRPFAAIFEQAGNDFYKIDPHLFSPAVVRLTNLDTGHTFRFGHTVPRVIHESFGVR